MSLSGNFSNPGSDRPAGGGFGNFNNIAPAAPLDPVPGGRYNAAVVSGMATATRAGDDAYRITFEILDGPYQGRRVFRTYGMGAKSIQYTRRDLAAFGITNEEQMFNPWPPLGKRCVCELLIALQRMDDGRELNDIKSARNIRWSDEVIDPLDIDPTKPINEQTPPPGGTDGEVRF